MINGWILYRIMVVMKCEAGGCLMGCNVWTTRNNTEYKVCRGSVCVLVCMCVCMCWGDGARGGKGREYGVKAKGGLGISPSVSRWERRAEPECVQAAQRRSWNRWGSQNKPKAPRPSQTHTHTHPGREREERIQAAEKRPRMEQQSQRKDTRAWEKAPFPSSFCRFLSWRGNGGSLRWLIWILSFIFLSILL